MLFTGCLPNAVSLFMCTRRTLALALEREAWDLIRPAASSARLPRVRHMIDASEVPTWGDAAFPSAFHHLSRAWKRGKSSAVAAAWARLTPLPSSLTVAVVFPSRTKADAALQNGWWSMGGPNGGWAGKRVALTTFRTWYRFLSHCRLAEQGREAQIRG